MVVYVLAEKRKSNLGAVLQSIGAEASWQELGACATCGVGGTWHSLTWL
jgi:hypothetical protein